MHLQEISPSFPLSSSGISRAVWDKDGWGRKWSWARLLWPFPDFSRKATESLTQHKCYLTHPDTRAGCWKTDEGFKSRFCKWGAEAWRAVAGVKEKENCLVHSAQYSLPHLRPSLQSTTPVPQDFNILSGKRNFSIFCWRLEIGTETNRGRNSYCRSRFAL